VTTTSAGDQHLLELADQHGRQRGWAIEGTGGDGAGLTRFLHGHQEQVVELDRPKRAVRRHGAKSDPLDAEQGRPPSAGRDQLASRERPGSGRRCRCG
jgi:transposase